MKPQPLDQFVYITFLSLYILKCASSRAVVYFKIHRFVNTNML